MATSTNRPLGKGINTVQELSVLAQSRRSAQAKIAEADAEKAIVAKLQEAAEILTPRAMEMYRLNVLERLGREEGSQIVVYGMGGSDPSMDRTIAATTAGAQTTVVKKTPNTGPVSPPKPKPE